MPTRIATSLPYTELEVAGPFNQTTGQGNFDESRAPIDRVIIHTMVGTWEGAAARFDNPTSQVSAHYGVKLDGTYIHWLEETFTAYHAGDYAMNQRSIGIEHEDRWNGQPPEPTRPDALYTASAKLVRDICQFYGIPIDREHILKHSEVSQAPTGCPDALDIDRIVREAANTQPTVTLPQAEVDQIRTDRDNHYNGEVAMAQAAGITFDATHEAQSVQEVVDKIKNLIANQSHAVATPPSSTVTSSTATPVVTPIVPESSPVSISQPALNNIVTQFFASLFTLFRGR